MIVWVCSANSDGTMRSVGYYDVVKVVDDEEKAQRWQSEGLDRIIQRFVVE